MGKLVLSRQPGEEVIIVCPDGTELTVGIVHVQRGKTRMSFVAPSDYAIWRFETYHQAKAQGTLHRTPPQAKKGTPVMVFARNFAAFVDTCREHNLPSSSEFIDNQERLQGARGTKDNQFWSETWVSNTNYTPQFLRLARIRGFSPHPEERGTE